MGLERCSRKRGVVGFFFSLGSGFEYVRIVVEWVGERYIVLVCVRN